MDCSETSNVQILSSNHFAKRLTVGCPQTSVGGTLTFRVDCSCLLKLTVMTESMPISVKAVDGSTSAALDNRNVEATHSAIAF